MFITKTELKSWFQSDNRNGALTYYDKGDDDNETELINKIWNNLIGWLEDMTQAMGERQMKNLKGEK